MTNKTSTAFTNEFIIDDQEDDSLLALPLSPEPVYTSDGFGGIDQQDYRPDTQFLVDIESACKQPGTLTGESCPLSDVVNNSYDYLSSQYPHWRRLLSDDYMRNTNLSDDTNSASEDEQPHKKLKTSHTTTPPQQLVLLHIDDHAWASVVHYLTACKFINQPEIYNSLTLDSGDPLSFSTTQQVRQHAHTKFKLSEHEEKDWYENGRKVEAWRRALLAKFAQNQDLQRALILTGWAKLVDKHKRVQHLLMWVRTVLRGDHKEEESAENTTALEQKSEVIPVVKKEEEEDSSSNSHANNKNIDEVLRVIEGLFGKDKQHVLSSVLAGGAIVNAQQQQTQQQEQVKKEEVQVKEGPKKLVEPKAVEMKDAVGYLEQIRTDEPPQTYSQFLEIMTDFRSEKINTPQVLERVTLLFKGKSWLIRNFLMFLPPGHITDLTPEGDKSNSIYITSPAGKKIILNTDEGKVIFE